MSILKKVKKDTVKDKSILKSSIEDIMLSYELVESILPRSNKKLPTSKLKKKFIANAFYIYDLYKILRPIFDEYTASSRRRISLKYKLEELSGFSFNAIEVYHTLMTAYIDNEGYKDLIIMDHNVRDYKKKLKQNIAKIKKNISDRKLNKKRTYKRLSENEKLKIIELHKKGKTGRMIKKELDNRALSTIQACINKYKETSKTN